MGNISIYLMAAPFICAFVWCVILWVEEKKFFSFFVALLVALAPTLVYLLLNVLLPELSYNVFWWVNVILIWVGMMLFSHLLSEDHKFIGRFLISLPLIITSIAIFSAVMLEGNEVTKTVAVIGITIAVGHVWGIWSKDV